MPKFIIHWEILVYLSNGSASESVARIAEAADQVAAKQMAYNELMDVFESNSSSGAVPLTKQIAEEYGVAFEEGGK